MNQYKSGTDEEEPQTLVIEPHSELAISHSGPENLKKSSPKKLVKSNKSKKIFS